MNRKVLSNKPGKETKPSQELLHHPVNNHTPTAAEQQCHSIADGKLEKSAILSSSME